MKVFLALLALSLGACAHHPAKQSEVNDLSVYYAQKGEEMTSTLQRVSRKNATQASVQALDPTTGPAVR